MRNTELGDEILRREKCQIAYPPRPKRSDSSDYLGPLAPPMPERPRCVLGHHPSLQTFQPAHRCFCVSPVCWQPCWVNTGCMMVNPTDVAPAFMALPDHGQGCLPWDLLSLKLPWECRRGPRPSSPPGIPRPGKTSEAGLWEEEVTHPQP